MRNPDQKKIEEDRVRQNTQWVEKHLLKFTPAERAIFEVNDIIRFCDGVMAASQHESYSSQQAIVSLNAIHEIAEALSRMYTNLVDLRRHYDDFLKTDEERKRFT